MGDRCGERIGYATALAFVDAGARVIGFDREFTQENYPFATEVMDVADAGQVAQVCQRVLQKRRGWMCWSTPPVFYVWERPMRLASTTGSRRLRSMGGAFNLFSQTMAQFRRQQGGRLSP